MTQQTNNTTAMTEQEPAIYTDVRNPRRKPYGIQCDVKFVSRDTYLSFLACPDDIVPYGRQIYQECLDGKWGEVLVYVPTDEEVIGTVQDRMYRELQRANSAVTKYQDLVDVDEATAADVAQLKAWKKYRVELNRIPEQAGYPRNVTWPVAPDAPAI